MARRIIGTPPAQASGDKLVKATHWYNNTRTDISTHAEYTFWTANFTKEKDANTSWILMDGMLPGASNYSDQCGVFAGLDGMDTNDDTPRHHGSYYAGVNDGAGWAKFIWQIHRIIKNDDSAQELAAGSRSWSVGFSPRDNGGGQRPFKVWNPNNNEDGRDNQHGSIMTIWEYLY